MGSASARASTAPESLQQGAERGPDLGSIEHQHEDRQGYGEGRQEEPRGGGNTVPRSRATEPLAEGRGQDGDQCLRTPADRLDGGRPRPGRGVDGEPTATRTVL